MQLDATTSRSNWNGESFAGFEPAQTGDRAIEEAREKEEEETKEKLEVDGVAP